MGKKIGIGVAALLAILILVIVTRPSEYRVERSVTIAAAPAKVYPWVADLRKFPEWSPWEKLDPKMNKEFTGTPAAVGAKYTWSGNSDVGTGSMTITELVNDQKVRMDLEFVEPWQSQAKTGLDLASEGEGTKVTWSMSGENDFAGKAMSLFMDMEGMIGASYEEGLGNLKAAVEKGA